MVNLVRAASLTNFSELFSALGGDPDAAMRRVGLRPALVREQDQLIDVQLTGRLLEDAAKTTGCTNFGLRMAQSRQVSNFGVVSLLLLHQPTLRTVLSSLIEHSHLLNESLLVHMEDVNGVVVLREEFTVPDDFPQSMELAIGVLFRTCEFLLRERWHPQRVCFSHAAPRDTSLHKLLFRCPVEFDADFDGIVLRTEDLEAANPLADPVLVRYAKTMVDTTQQGRQVTVAQRVRKAIYLMLPSGSATCTCVAQGLGRSVRTLQRELDSEGVSFSDLLVEVRYELAQRYVRNPDYSVGQIANLLGYNSHSAFTRWFTTLFDCSPETWREKHIAPHIAPRKPGR
ncbi:MAG: AraC family transcriptional regulator [Comamonas sp.]